MRKIAPSSGTIERISRLGLQANKGWIVGLAPPAEPAWPKIVFVPTSLRPADAGATLARRDGDSLHTTQALRTLSV